MEDVIPKSAQWIQAAATAFDPDNNRVVLEGGRELEYDYLVVAAGIRSDWDAVPGVREGLDRPESGVVSVYDYSYSAKVWSEYNRIKDWDRKTLVFTMPPTPIKCAGAPQKIMWLLEDRLRRANQRDTASVEFWVPGPAMFSVPYYSAKLEKLREERGVAARFRHELVSLDVDRRVATFRDLGGGGGGSRLVEKRYDLIHVVPHMGPPDAIKNSPLAEASPPGYMDVDPATLRSARYRNVFGLGDCTNTPNSKTAAAVTRQAPVVVHNLGRVIRGLEPDGAYDGYASCPLVTGIGRCLLAEFGYGGKIMETFGRRTGPFPLNLVGTDGPLQQRFFYFLKEKVFPFVYWNLWTRGYWYGTRGPFRPNVVPNPDPKADGKDAAK
jgi:sulfide:quinone oxidoreductase